MAQHDPTVGRDHDETADPAANGDQCRPAPRRNQRLCESGRLAALLLTVVRGVEAVGMAGLDPETLRNITDTALAVLPMPEGKRRPTTRQPPGDDRK